MNILSVHNRYLYRGGEDESSELENSLLRAKGHEVVEYVADNHDIRGRLLVEIGARSLWNPRTYTKARQVIREKKIDLVKVDNFFPQISPAIFYAASAEGVPTVQALRNFRLLCPGALFYRNGAVCEDCVGRVVPWPAVLHGCYRNSRAQTFAPAAMTSVHKMMGTWRSRVTAYVALSEFSRNKFVDSGFPPDKIFVKPNFVQDVGVGGGASGTAIFVGRLSPEKGISTLLDAWKLVGHRIRLKIVGTGPLEGMVREAAAINPDIEYLGQRPLDETYELMGSSMALIFTSNWYETFGRTIAEAYAKGTPVIGANLGNMTTMITHGVTGRHFEPGNAQSLAEQVNWMLDHPAEWQQMREAARHVYEDLYAPERNYRMMMSIYRNAMTMKAVPLHEND